MWHCDIVQGIVLKRQCKFIWTGGHVRRATTKWAQIILHLKYCKWPIKNLKYFKVLTPFETPSTATPKPRIDPPTEDPDALPTGTLVAVILLFLGALSWLGCCLCAVCKRLKTGPTNILTGDENRPGSNLFLVSTKQRNEQANPLSSSFRGGSRLWKHQEAEIFCLRCNIWKLNRTISDSFWKPSRLRMTFFAQFPCLLSVPLSPPPLFYTTMLQIFLKDH